MGGIYGNSLSRNRMSDMEWTDLVQEREWWRAVVNTVMNLRVA
jgi:hypothetical protein